MIENAAKIETAELTKDAIIKPAFLPIKLINLVAMIAPKAIPIIETERWGYSLSSIDDPRDAPNGIQPFKYQY